MALYLGLLLFSFFVSSALTIPFIDLLFRLHLTNSGKNSPPQHRTKIGTPLGAGLLILVTVTVLFFSLFPALSRLGLAQTSIYPVKEEINIIFLTFISFGLLGFYEDLVKIFFLKHRGSKTGIQILLSLIISTVLYYNFHLDAIYIPLHGAVFLGPAFIAFAFIIILLFTRGYDVTDGLDGLAGGVLLISLLALWAVSLTVLDVAISIFVALWLGSLIAFLYFNVYPARIWLGDSGSLAFGSTLAVLGLLLGKTSALMVIGAVFVIEAVMHLLYNLALRFSGRRIFPVSPVHFWLLRYWPEPKVVLRIWLLTGITSVFGLWIALG